MPGVAMSTAGLERFAAAADADPTLLDRYREARSVGALASRLREDGYDVDPADLDACRIAPDTGYVVVAFGTGLRLALPKPGRVAGNAGLDALFSHLQRHMTAPPGGKEGDRE